MSEPELLAADLWATGVSTDGHPIQPVRPHLDEIGAVAITDLDRRRHRSRVRVGGIVTHRQRPATASGTTFMNIEDETGLVNVVCSAGAWARYRRVARSAPALLIRGRIEKVDGVINVVAERIDQLSLSTSTMRSRDFR